MEEEKAAAYYDELSRKGSGAARFKQGLGFSSSSSGAASSASDPPPRGSAVASSSSSFLSQFVRASNPSSEKGEYDREKQKSQIESIQNKLRKRDPSVTEPQSKDRERRDSERRRHIRRSRTPERRRSRRSRSRSHSSEDRERHRSRERKRSRRSRSRSFSDEERRRGRDRRRRRSRSRNFSPNYERSEKGKGDRERGRRSAKESNVAIDYAKLIKGYDEMTPAGRVKAKMKFQLSETAAKDTKIGTGSGWERFDFDKDAPLDNDDEEVEGANDDAKLVKHLGQTFRFSNVQARREEEIKAAHDEAIFGAPVSIPSESVEETEDEKTQMESNTPVATNLFSDQVIAKKQGSWRDRAPRNI